MKKLTKQEITKKLKELPDWRFHDNALETSMEFETFKDCFSIMARIAFEIEVQNHHPEWCNMYNKLSIRLNTHEVDGVTEKDFKLADTIETIISNK